MAIETFQDLPLAEPIQRALQKRGYEKPSPIQAAAIPFLLEGHDLMGCAQTGTGKTAAFALPILHRLLEKFQRPPRRGAHALVLTPTRELALQVEGSFTAYGQNQRMRTALVYGGVSARPQINTMRLGVDVLVATPGRLLDLIQQGHIQLEETHTLVLDEMDRMLDMGFINDIRKIVRMLPKERQTILFSATMSPEIRSLANTMVRDPKEVTITPDKPVVEKIDQHLCFTKRENKHDLLTKLLGDHQEEGNSFLTLVFSRTKYGAEKLAKRLTKSGFPAGSIHGDKSQAARQKALEQFRRGKTPVLVATDVAARGIDVKGITLVINFDLPEEPETYVHRIGRTARAEAQGRAISFCSSEETKLLRDVEQLIRMPIKVFSDHPFHATDIQRWKPYQGKGRGAQGGRGGQQRSAGGRRSWKPRRDQEGSNEEFTSGSGNKKSFYAKQFGKKRAAKRGARSFKKQPR